MASENYELGQVGRMTPRTTLVGYTWISSGHRTTGNNINGPDCYGLGEVGNCMDILLKEIT